MTTRRKNQYELTQAEGVEIHDNFVQIPLIESWKIPCDRASHRNFDIAC